ncbi:MAG: hypothetical protein WA634_04145 [Silvibacterium sp.]
MIALKVLGWILIAASVVGFFAAGLSSGSAMASFSILLGGVTSAILAFGFAAVITKLCEIESHLRRPVIGENQETKKAGATLGL